MRALLIPEGEAVFEGGTEDGPVARKLSNEPVDDEPELGHGNAGPCPLPHSVLFREMLHSMNAYERYPEGHRDGIEPVDETPFRNRGLEQRK